MKEHLPFKKWQRDDLVKLLEYIEHDYPQEFERIMKSCERWWSVEVGVEEPWVGNNE